MDTGIGIWGRFILGGQTSNLPEKVTVIMVLPEKSQAFARIFPRFCPNPSYAYGYWKMTCVYLKNCYTVNNK